MERYCKKCGAPILGGENFCGKCGEPVKISGKRDNIRKKKGCFKLILIGVICIFLVAATAVSAFYFLSGRFSKSGDYVVYIKENSLLYSTPKKDGSHFKLTDNLYKSYNSADRIISVYINQTTTVSNDGKKVFFTQNFDFAEQSMSLYYMKLDGKKPQPVLIGRNVTDYYISDDGQIVYYLKIGGLLCEYNTKNKKGGTIAENVSDLQVAVDCRAVVWRTDGKALYRKSINGESVKIDTDVDYLYSSFNSGKSVYYIKNKAICMYTENGDRKRISSGVVKVLKFYESGEVYYFKKGSFNCVLSDYIDDDLAKSDSLITEPVPPSVPQRESYSSDEEYNKAVSDYRVGDAKYSKELEEYNKKLKRDDIRVKLKSVSVSYDFYDLYCFDGTSEKKLAENVQVDLGLTTARCNDTKPVITYSTAVPDNIARVRASEVEDTEVLGSYMSSVEREIYKSGKRHIAVGQNTNTIDGNYTDVMTDDDGKYVYVLEEIEGELYPIYNAYSIMIDGGNLGEPELYMERVQDFDIVCGGVYCEAVEKKLYVDTKRAYVYYNKQKLGLNDRIKKDNIAYNNGNIYYLDIAALSVCDKNGNIKRISDNVYGFYVLKGGAVAYMSSYDTVKQTSNLYIYKNETNYKIDENIDTMLYCTDNKYGVLF